MDLNKVVYLGLIAPTKFFWSRITRHRSVVGLGSAMRRKAQNPCPRREFLESGGKQGKKLFFFAAGPKGKSGGKRHLGPQAKTDPVPRVYQRLINQPTYGSRAQLAPRLI